MNANITKLIDYLKENPEKKEQLMNLYADYQKNLL